MIRRGEVWVANLNPGRGREVDTIQPVLVIQDNALTAIGTPMIIVLPLTARVNPAFRHWRVTSEPRDRLLKTCQVLIDQARALDTTRLGGGPLTILTDEEMAAVEKSLKAVLGLG